MSKTFKLVNKEFIEDEQCWIYEIEITFNYQAINRITITDHPWQKPGRNMITNELILELLKKMDGQVLKPLEYQGWRKVYKWETPHQGQKYRLIFWFKDETTNHLWIRNCYPLN